MIFSGSVFFSVNRMGSLVRSIRVFFFVCLFLLFFCLKYLTNIFVKLKDFSFQGIAVVCSKINCSVLFPQSH